MTLTVTHTFVNAVADDPSAASAGEVLPSHWNASHTLSGSGTLTKSNDTNVTLTLGGTPSGSLINDVSITAGWSGTLAVARGGTGTGTAFTTGSVVFADGSGIYSQDNAKFSWDDSAFILKAGTQLQQIVNGVFVKALYPIYNASGDNWFIGEAGNLTTTGNGNVGIGASALAAVTSGSGNVCIGPNAGLKITGAANNFAMGSAALASVTGSNNNVAIGRLALTLLYGTLVITTTSPTGVANTTTLSFSAADAQRIFLAWQNKVGPKDSAGVPNGTQAQFNTYLAQAALNMITHWVTLNEVQAVVPPPITVINS